MLKTLKVRVKDKHAPVLRRMAQSVNLVWNYCNEVGSRAIRERGKRMNSSEFWPYLKGANKMIGLHSQTVQAVAEIYVSKRSQFRKNVLAWRKTGGAKRSLGWVPFKSQAIYLVDGRVYHNGHHFDVWDSYGLEKYKFRAGSFNEDARGRWYFNVWVDDDTKKSIGQGAVGIDLGLKATATCSDGRVLAAGRFYHDLEAKLGMAQRARRKHLVRTINAKIANRRKDALHKFSRELVNSYGEIYVGDVGPAKLAKTRMAKSVLDSGWGQLKTMLSYKSDHAGIVFKVVSEAHTTRTCSSCGSLSGPKGVNGLRIREWSCVDCGDAHDRDVNAAKNILAVGHGRLEEEKPRH